MVYFCFYLFFPRYYKRDKEAKDAEGQLQGLQKELADLEGKLAVSEQQRKHWEREYNVIYVLFYENLTEFLCKIPCNI